MLRQEGFVTIDRRRGASIAVDVDKIKSLEEMKENLVTNVKKIIVPKKRMNLHTLLFSTNNIVDVDIFFKYIGQFSEGSMELYIYKTENESLDEKMYLCVKVIDEESILIERNIDG